VQKMWVEGVRSALQGGWFGGVKAKAVLVVVVEVDKLQWAASGRRW
jgi:hypothetical protein